MTAHGWNDVIVAALAKPDGHALHNMIEHMRDCERAKQVLFAKGYGKPGMSVAHLAALVPVAPKRVLSSPCGPMSCESDEAKASQ